MRITADRLREVLSYDEITGQLTWRLVGPKSRVSVGSIAGTKRPDGYIAVKVDGEIILAHRLAWVWMYGEEPQNDIDHADGDRSNNRKDNLREATRQQNRQNQFRSNSNTGMLGVSWCKREGKFRAYITNAGKMKSLGYYENKEDARSAYLEEKKVLHPFAMAQK